MTNLILKDSIIGLDYVREYNRLVNPSHPSHDRRLATGAAVNLAGKLFGRGVHILTQILLARWLGPAVFGLYAIGWNFLRLGSSILPMGIDIAALQIGAAIPTKDKNQTSTLVITAIWITTILALFSSLAVFIGADWLAAVYQKPELGQVLRLMSLALFLAILLRVGAYLTRISLRMESGIIAEEILQPLGNLLVVLVLALTGIELLGAIWATTASLALGAVYLAVKIKNTYAEAWSSRSFDRQVARNLWKVARPIAVAAVFSTLVLLTDRLFVGFYRSEVEAGIFQAASLFSVFFVTVLSALKTIVAPIFSATFASGDRNRLRETFVTSTRWGLYLSIPLLVPLLFIPGKVLEATYGSLYADGAAALCILTVAQLANLLSGPVEYVLVMTENPRDWLKISALTFIVNIAGNVWLVPELGLVGAALATLISFLLMSLISLLVVWRRLAIFPIDGSYWKGFLAATSAAGIILLVGRLNLGGALIEVALTAGLGFAGFAVVLWRLGMEAVDREMLAMVLSRLKV
ncbi:MAG: flippase [Anaerolineales bacterium]|nr:flippase [Anaerolineales bacterium]